jgi:tRNA-2-methylthio-N6-dimethylallyladenosine synthase
MRVYLETLGCQMNQLDSELAEQLLRSAGHEMVCDRRRAEAVLYNTCSVRDHAEQKVTSRLGADAKRQQAARRRGRAPLIVGALGCMAQRMGESLAKKYQAVDFLCAPGQLHQLVELLESAAESRQARLALDPSRNAPRDTRAEGALETIDAGRDVDAGRGEVSTFVRVMRGCDKFCSYCIVPFVRGPERSRAPDAIVEEVRRLVEAGRSEITLLGQTVNSYRHQATGRTTSFAELLAKVSPIAGLRRLRFVTSYPEDFGEDILQAMRDLPNVCEYLHIPAQSGSDAMLRAMNRRYSRAQYDELIDRARQTVPDIALAGDFIVGFPGESDADHDASAELIRRVGYKNTFIFKYSPRPDTAAAKRLTDDVPEAVKKRRNNELLAVQAEVGQAHHAALVGQTLEVLVTGPSPKHRGDTSGTIQLTGRTRGDHIVLFDGRAEQAGAYLPVRIDAAQSLALFGSACEE